MDAHLRKIDTPAAWKQRDRMSLTAVDSSKGKGEGRTERYGAVIFSMLKIIVGLQKHESPI